MLLKLLENIFPEIDDKILNILQLNELSDSDNLLIQASIYTKRLKIFNPFPLGIVSIFRNNKISEMDYSTFFVYFFLFYF